MSIKIEKRVLQFGGFLGHSVLKNLPADAGDTGDLGGFHMP